jgi:hypothetical protein
MIFSACVEILREPILHSKKVSRHIYLYSLSSAPSPFPPTLSPAGLSGAAAAKFESGSMLSPSANHQIMLDIKACIFSVGEATELSFVLYSAKEKCILTEVRIATHSMHLFPFLFV